MKIHLHLQKTLVFFLLLCLNLKSFTQKLSITAYTPGLTSPIAVTHGGDDRLFVAERAGRVRVINPDGTLRATPFLDITAKVPSLAGEEGLLGLALSPDFLTSGKFYVNYVTVNTSGTYSVIEEYKTSTGDPNIADTTALTLLTQLQPNFSNHKGGNLMIGKDGYLYISLGDGGNGGDPFGNGQNTTTFLGKILRIDVSNSSVAQPYSIPPTNPFANDPSTTIKKEIWAYGVRNPFRCSIDRITGDAWIADVGQGDWEEIDYDQYNNVSRNANYGWNIAEGNHCYPPGTSCDLSPFKLPIYEYNHDTGQSIIGGYAYRSAQSKALFGMYLYTDYVAKRIDGFRQNNGAAILPVQRLLTGSQVGGNPISFGEDKYGDLYMLFNGDGTVYQINDTAAFHQPKAYFTPDNEGGRTVLHGLQGRNLTYQWYKDGTLVSTSPDYTPTSPGTYRLVLRNSLGDRDTSDAYVFGALPLTLNNFIAQRQSAKAVTIQWQTSQQDNISGFTILKKFSNEADFSVIASVPVKVANGSGTGADYSFLDANAGSDLKLFYRLKIQNKDGSFFYSDIRIINGSNNNGFVIYPNPAKDKMVISINDYTNPVQLVIYDHLGRKVKQQTLQQSSNTINITGLKGVYTVTLITENNKNIVREKLLVQ